jgi:hypothetical protein
MALPVVAKTDLSWTGLSSFGENISLRRRVENLIFHLDWDSLLDWVSKVHKPCKIDLDFAVGYRHLVRSLKFPDSSEGILRVRLPSIDPQPFQTATETRTF